MTAMEFIQSGIIETYCLGFTSEEEELLVKQMQSIHPEVNEEIVRVRASYSSFLLNRKVIPSPSVKKTVMNTIYSEQSVLKKEWVPLMHEPIDFKRYYEAVAANNLTPPPAAFDNMFVQELPSTKEVINFAVWAKQGHAEETHDDRNEYIAILEGSCDMYMNGIVTSYTQGQVISIYPNIPHHAVITSAQPMFALVQRQLVG